MKKRIFFLPYFIAVITALALVNPIWAQPEELYVFAHKNVSDSAVTRAAIQKIYLGKKDKWADNQSIHFSSFNSGPCYEIFIKRYVKKTEFQFQNYWKKQIFTGKGQPPRGFDAEDDLVDYVSRTTGAIGYSCIRPDTSKVKILTIK